MTIGETQVVGYYCVLSDQILNSVIFKILNDMCINACVISIAQSQ